MIPLLLAHALAALLAPALVRALGRWAFPLLALVPAAGFGLVASRGGWGSGPRTEEMAWVPSLDLSLAFRVDDLSRLLALVVLGVGALVLLYCTDYFEGADAPCAHADRLVSSGPTRGDLGRLASCLVAFAGAMLGLVTTDDVLALYVFWEITSVLSFLLIGHAMGRASARASAVQAMIITVAGGLAMLAGLIMLAHAAGTHRISGIVEWGAQAGAHPGPLVVTAVILVLAAAVTKSALVPVHYWLPGAMAAPTPISAYLHAAAMVKAGIYLIARFAPGFAAVPAWQWLVLVLGSATMLVGAWRSLRQHDVKLVLAYGTVSQLGFLTLLVGRGTEAAATAGIALLLAHALFKSCLFLIVGAIDHATGTRDRRVLSGLARQMPVLAVSAVLAAASMAGLPPMLGFVSKEAAYGTYLDLAHEHGWASADGLVLGVLVAGSVMTFAYSARFVLGAFGTRRVDGVAVEPTHAHRLGPFAVAVPAVLAALTLAGGWPSKALAEAVHAWAQTLPASAHPQHLGLWHGVNAALLLSALTVGLGLALVMARHLVEHTQLRLHRVLGVLEAEGTYRAAMRATDHLALRVTSAFQRGSLPRTLGTIVAVAVALPVAALVPGLLSPDGASLPTRVVAADSPVQAAVVLLVLGALVGALRTERRFRAVVLVGATGYGLAALFLLHGAPDLALTQVLVETISLVVIVLVLRRLPGSFREPAGVPARRGARALLATAVGIVAAGLVLVAAAARHHLPASEGLPTTARALGGGSNIVNVVLVDTRAWDTMGEIAVILVCAAGVASLVFLREERRVHAVRGVESARAAREVGSEPHLNDSRWIVDARGVGVNARVTILEVVTRLVFHLMMLWSVYLLLTGHNAPGGGFAGGLVAGLALAVRYLAGGRHELRAALPVMPTSLLGTGLFLAAGTAIGAMVAGGHPLQSWALDIPVPVIGPVHLVTTLAFDIGVYLVVMGLALDLLTSLGGGLDAQVEREDAQARGDAPGHGLTEEARA